VIATQNGSDQADGYSGVIGEDVDQEDDDDNSADKNKSELGKTTKLVLDIARPFFHTGRVLNIDCYYTSPELMLELRKQGLYARGTCMTNRRMFPKAVIFTEAEARREKRGTSCLAVNKENNLVAIGWIDGNPVHLITTADGTEISHVK
jgi:Transposase IS4